MHLGAIGFFFFRSKKLLLTRYKHALHSAHLPPYTQKEYMIPFSNLFFSSVALVICLGLWLFKSRLTLYLALRRQRAATGAIQIDVVQVPAYTVCELSSFIDSLYGWAGSITVKRDSSGSVGSFIVECRRGEYRSGPSDNQALYVDGKKLKANSSCKVGPQSLLILRQMGVTPSIVQVRLV